MGVVNEPQIIRNEKGQIVKPIPQDTNKNGTAGRPCEFCQRKDEILKITQDYINTGKGDKPKMVYINELALFIGCDRDKVADWKNKKMRGGNYEHPEFHRLVKELESIQELRLQQRIMGRYNPTGAIFLLKTKHGYIETEKKVHAGDPDEPLEIIITEEKSQNE